MDVKKESIYDYEVAIWDTIKSISEVKNQVSISNDYKKEELRILQNELMEAAEWMNLST